MGYISLIQKVAETQDMIAETEHRVMAANRWAQTWSNTEAPESSRVFTPESEPVDAEVEGANIVEGEMEIPTGTNVTEAKEEAQAYAAGSDNQHAATEKAEDVASTKSATEERTPRALWRPQFGSMSLAEAENYSSWRGSRTI